VVWFCYLHPPCPPISGKVITSGFQILPQRPKIVQERPPRLGRVRTLP
jgi:hypothetical protein